jgi:hypothetical protein
MTVSVACALRRSFLAFSHQSYPALGAFKPDLVNRVSGVFRGAACHAQGGTPNQNSGVGKI